MNRISTNIDSDSFVTDIVTKDYRASVVFRKYGIDYCCCGKLPLQTVCERLGIDTDMVKNELRNSLRIIQVSSSINFNNWTVDFLVDYILNVHHRYLVENFPDIIESTQKLVEHHQSKYAYLPQLLTTLDDLRKHLMPHLEQEEKIIFPYIKQIAHAYERQEPYAGLLVRTLRKPVETITQRAHEAFGRCLHRLRELSNDYSPVSNTCLSHRVVFSKLKELDNDLVQQIHLESNILFPKALAMEREMLTIG